MVLNQCFLLIRKGKNRNMWVLFFGMYLNIETTEESLREETPCHGDESWVEGGSSENQTL